ncbi:hypothetical protein GQ457_07G009310 [Hibiscus cannabinus]
MMLWRKNPKVIENFEGSWATPSGVAFNQEGKAEDYEDEEECDLPNDLFRLMKVKIDPTITTKAHHGLIELLRQYKNVVVFVISEYAKVQACATEAPKDNARGVIKSNIGAHSPCRTTRMSFVAPPIAVCRKSFKRPI